MNLSTPTRFLILLNMCLALGPACSPMTAQVLRSSAPLPAFAVASIRPSRPDAPDAGLAAAPGGGVSAASATLKTMILYAYGLGSDDELVGGPDWLRTEKFQLQAKVDEAQAAALTTLSADDRSEQLRLMLQSLLADRFHLRVRAATRTLPVYSLVIAPGGLKCIRQPTDTPFAALPKSRFRSSIAPPPPPPPPGYRPPTTPEEIAAHALAPVHVRTKGWPFWMVVTVLSHQPELGGRTVVDKTGLAGSYDCEATWTREGGDGPYFFTSIQEQMGLRLQPEKAPVEVLVVEHVERPSQN